LAVSREGTENRKKKEQKERGDVRWGKKGSREKAKSINQKRVRERREGGGHQEACRVLSFENPKFHQ